MTRVLILGRGQLARALAGVLPIWGETTTWGRETVDLLAPSRLTPLLDSLRPDYIFNAAAYTQIDTAENDEEKAKAINGEAPASLAAWARENWATLVHYSTDYVFDGEKPGPYLESDAPNPLNAYGRSKLLGDEAIQKVGGAYYIFRTSWVYGLGGRNFPATILKLAQSRETVEVVDSQVGAPTSAEFLALASAFAAFQPQKAYGLYNLTASGAVSWHGLAQYLVEKSRHLGLALTLKPEGVLPVPSRPDYPARRPANSVLANAKFRATFGIGSPAWPFYLDRFLEAFWGARG